ncbi:hypothetical protein ACW9KT_21510 [Hymenobacter sp. HD11105]
MRLHETTLHENARLRTQWCATSVSYSTQTEIAYIYRPDQSEPNVVQGFDNELSGEAVLPGFQLRLAELR